MKIRHYNVTKLFFVAIFFTIILSNTDFFGRLDSVNNHSNFLNINFLQPAYGVENEDDDDEDSEEKEDNTKKTPRFNVVAVGDWDCTSETEDTVDNIGEQDPELVLALGDLSYNGEAECWLEVIEPIDEKTKIVLGNHEDSSDLMEDYMEHFGMKEQYYSFNHKNVHFLALSTETSYDDESEQYKFAEQDLKKYSNDALIDWIIVFYHRYAYASASSLEAEDDFRETYHPLFDKYKVDLALQGHLHVYERTYPITFNPDDDDEPIIQDQNENTYKNPKGPIFVTVGTGGAHAMTLSSSADFSAVGVEGDFGILDITFETDGKTLTGKFIENGKKQDVKDEFKIIKDKK